MVRMKKSELSEITHTFEEAYHLFKSAMKDNKNPAEEDLVYADLLLKSEAIYDSISRMTVWPFNKQHVARLGSVMTIIATMTTIVSFFRI